MSTSQVQPRRISEIGALFPLGILAGVLLGILTDTINVWLSPDYFGRIDGDAHDIWLHAMAYGVWEGAWLGAFCGLVTAIYIGFVSRLRCPSKLGVRALLETMMITLLFWVVGGFNAVLLALLAPQFYDLFNGLPSNSAEAVRFAWVAGSIPGAEIGALIAVCIACARFGARWKREMKVAENEIFDDFK